MKDVISIIIPAYNVGDYLAECLDSVLAQTYANIEVIVVDDGSKDCTLEVMNMYAARECRIKAIHKENGGVTSARLCGVAEATGEWIGFVDGDDYIEPDMFERLLCNAKTYNVDISHCGYRMVFPDGRTEYFYNTGHFVQQDTMTGLKDLLEGSFVEPSPCNKLFRKHLFYGLLHSNKMDLTIRNTEDLLMNFYLFREANGAVYEDVCPYYYKLRNNSATTSRLNEYQLKDPLIVFDILYNETDRFSDLQMVVQMRCVRRMIFVATMPVRGRKSLIVPYRKKIRKRLRRELKQHLQNPACSLKVKCMALWAAICPQTYGIVHRFASILNGNARKYKV